MGRSVACAVLVASVLCAAAARADEPREQARKHFERGKQEFAAVRYQRALEEFKAAYAIAPFPEMLYNIARCEEELHQNQAAIETYQRYTAVSTSAVEREELAQRIERLRRESAVTAPAPAVLVRAPAPPPRARPIYRRWWLWTIVGGVAAASLAVGLGVGLGTSSSPSAPAFPPLTVQPTR